MMIKEEESLRSRLINSIQTCKTDMEKLCLELQIPVFEVREAQPVSQLLRLRALKLFTDVSELDNGDKWHLSLGGERHQHAPAGEEHPHAGGGSAEGEGLPDAAA